MEYIADYFLKVGEKWVLLIKLIEREDKANKNVYFRKKKIPICEKYNKINKKNHFELYGILHHAARYNYT